jgi:peptidase E
VHEAGQYAGVEVSCLNLFGMPPSDDLDDYVGSHDVVWVNGGSVANLLAVWQVHELGPVMHRAWQAGVVLGGISAGSICWHVGGPTDSFGPELRIVTNGLAFLPYGNGVHYDSEELRRPLVHAGVADERLPLTYCTDDGAGLLYRGTELSEVVTERKNALGYRVERDPATGNAVEHVLDTRQL